ncbi:MAG: hypothetical protein GY832_07990 [Chloroflexi bacterium]|nr:hypothetical protein [Chloroflexota bacterium]
MKIPSDPTANKDRKRVFRPRPSFSSPPVLATLLILAFVAGLSLSNLLIPPAHISAPPNAYAPFPLNPLTPTPLQPSPTPPPTPTATTPGAGDTLETLYIEIAPADVAQIEAKRKQALQLGILLSSGGDYVPATIRVGTGGSESPVELRLKGDWTDHFASDKWSFRVRAMGENYVFGMRTFSLQDPSTRTFLNEWALLQNLRLEGVLGVRYRFVHIVLNEEYKGIYALEEGFSKELFEAQERREGLIIRYDEDLVWEYRAFYDDQLVPQAINEFYIIDEFQSGRINADPALSAQRDVAVGLLRALWTGEQSGAQVFNIETMGRFLALSDLWRARHALVWHNLRYYYDPITARLEPVAFDCHPLASTRSTEGIGLPQETFYRDPYLQAAYVRELERITQPGYVEQLEAQLGPQFDALYAALEPEFGPDVLARPWDTLRIRQGLLCQMLDPYQTIYAYAQRDERQMAIDVGNLLDLPVEIVGLEVDGAMLPAHDEWVQSESSDLVVPSPLEGFEQALVLRPLDPQATHIPYVHLQIPPPATFPTDTVPEINVVTRLWGQSTTHTQTVLPGYALPLAQGPLPTPPTVEQALGQHPYLQLVDGQDTLRIAGGMWDVNGDLILPAGFGLRLDPGTTLRFGHNNLLLSRGPLDFQGTVDAPILLQPKQSKESQAAPVTDRWNGIVVLQADGPSAWNYVTVERASAVDRDGWTLTGGVTFYASPIRLENCRILNSQAEDGINVIRTEFAFVRSEFAHTASDAFDADFSQGVVEECVFHDIGGDGIDVSGSDVRLHSVRLLDIGDKAISVGEASRLTAQDVYMENVTFGLVSKDLSRATLDDATIVNARRAGLAVYVKKPAYGPASLGAHSITFVDVPPEQHTLVQTGSWIDLEDTRIWGVDFDVEGW